MNVAHYIARRYFFSRSGKRAVNVLSMVSLLGVMVGTAALFVVLAAFSGLEGFIMAQRSPMEAALKITATEGKRFHLKASSLAAIRSTPGVAKASAVLETKVFLERGAQHYIALARGVDSCYSQVVPIDSAMRRGEFLSDCNSRAAVLSTVVANRLEADPDAFLRMLVPRAGRGQITDLRHAFYQAMAYLKGTFSLEGQTDPQYVITSLRFLQGLLHYTSDESSAVLLSLERGAADKTVKERLEKTMGKDYRILTRKDQRAGFYKIMNTENAAAYFIFGLILLIATFSVAASITVLIIEKKADFQTLSKLGLPLRNLKRIALYEGLWVSLSGGVAGLLLGIAVVLSQERFHWVYIKSRFNAIPYPMALRLTDLSTVAATVFFLAIVCASVASIGLNKKFLAR